MEYEMEEYEMESESEASPHVDFEEAVYEEAVYAARQLFEDHPWHLPSVLQIASLSVPIGDVVEDYERLHRQIDILQNFGLPALAVDLQLTTPTGLDIRVLSPVDFVMEDYEPRLRFEQTEAELYGSGLNFQEVSKDESKDIFWKRSADYIGVRATYIADSGSPNDPVLVTIITRRHGDPIVYAKGYFHSTKTGFGFSYPASNYLPAGRYDFGIIDGGKTRWNGVLWSVRSTPTIHVPLP